MCNSTYRQPSAVDLEPPLYEKKIISGKFKIKVKLKLRLLTSAETEKTEVIRD